MEGEEGRATGENLKDLEVLAISKLGILFAEQKADHLASLHARTNDISVLIPTVGAFLWTLQQNQMYNLC